MLKELFQQAAHRLESRLKYRLEYLLKPRLESPFFRLKTRADRTP